MSKEEKRAFFRRWKLVAPDDERVFILSKLIEERSEMLGAVIYGMQRSGKTMYSLLVMYDLYEDWDKVLDNVFFNLEDLIRAIKERVLTNFSASRQLKAICWDDAGVHGSKYLFFRSKQLAEYLQNLFDVIGLAVKAILITTPNPENLLKAVRGYEFLRVKIGKLNDGNRVAYGYKSILLPSGKMIVRKVFKDYYNVYIPNDVYKQYLEMREQYLEEAVENLEQFLKGKKWWRKGKYGSKEYETEEQSVVEWSV